MTKTPKNSQEVEKPPDVPDAPNDSTWNKPNLKGDWCNLFLLTLLYTIQGIPFGFSFGLPIILQSKNMVTYNEQGSLSFVIWPYTMKLLWAPIVDSFYVRRIGRRKSWFIPVQYLIGVALLFFAYNTDEWLPESGKPNIMMIACLLFVINMLNTTQDIIVDSWALTMLKKNNITYASTCNCTGIAIGMFIGSVSPILLSSEKFCNNYLRLTPGTEGIISIKNIIFLWGIVCIAITTLVTIFKKEKKDTRLEDVKINIFQSYKILWSIMKLPSMRIFLTAVLTSKIGYSTMETVVNLKLIDAGVSKDDIMILTSAMSVLRIVLPLLLVKYTGGSKPLSLYLKCTPIRLLWSVPYALLIYYTPFLIKNNGFVNVPVYYYFILGFIFTINELLNNIMIITHCSFFIMISDPLFGGTYLTLLNTARNLSWIVSNTVILKMVDILSFKKCSNDGDDCSTTDFQNICNTKQGRNCVMILDGYYIEVVICMVVGCVWYGIFKSHYKVLQSKSLSCWTVDLNRPVSVYL